MNTTHAHTITLTHTRSAHIESRRSEKSPKSKSDVWMRRISEAIPIVTFQSIVYWLCYDGESRVRIEYGKRARARTHVHKTRESCSIDKWEMNANNIPLVAVPIKFPYSFQQSVLSGNPNKKKRQIKSLWTHCTRTKITHRMQRAW